MMSIFRKKVEDAVREFNDSNMPSDVLPDVPNSESEVLGRDANLPLVIKELAPVQLSDLRKEREKLTRRLAELDEKEKTLTALLAVINK
jgi:isopentenyl diphosphate isomerase/L-lactate dehydrogenase-like FMN-dependent dehydrogenase